MKKVYICCPVKGDQGDPDEIRNNIARSSIYSRWVYKQGFFPVCAPLYLENATGLEEETNREELLNLGIEMLLISDEIWVFGREEGSESSGMKKEIELARTHGRPVRYITQELL